MLLIVEAISQIEFNKVIGLEGETSQSKVETYFIRHSAEIVGGSTIRD
jgi:hypothetical protein